MKDSALPVVYSYSRLDSFRQCPRQYAYRYIEKPDIEKQTTVEAHLGNVCHETVQQIYRDLRLSKLMTLEETLAFYDAAWTRRRTPGLRIVRARYDEEHYRITGRKYVCDFYESNRPFQDGATIGIEKQVEIRLGKGPGGIALVGYVDRLVDRGNGHYEIVDYKTNSDLPGQAALEENWQLPLYHIGLLQMFPDLRDVTCTWHFLAHNKRMSLKRTEADLGTLEGDVLGLVQKIEAAKEFEPRASALCSWCDYEVICPARKHLVKTEGFGPEEFARDDGVRLVDALMRMKDEVALREAKIEEIEGRIIRYARANNLQVVRGTEDKIRVWSKKGALQVVSKEKNPAAALAISDILRKHGLWDRFSNLASFSLAKAVEGGDFPSNVAQEIEPYLVREDVWRLYPSKFRERR